MEIGTQVSIKEGNYYCYLNKFKLVVDDIVLDQHLIYPIAVRIGDTDSFEWFTQDELQIV